MKKKCISLCLIIMFLINQISIIYANAFVTGGNPENPATRYGTEVTVKVPATVPAIPHEPYPEDEAPPPPVQTPNITQQQEQTLLLKEKREIRGNAFEDYQQENIIITNVSSEGERLTTSRVETNNKKDSNEPGIEHVKVELIKEGETEPTSTTYTDENGSYEFVNIEDPGNYYLRFTYGLVENIEDTTQNHLNNDEELEKVKDILRYNGQDYEASHAGTRTNDIYKTSFYEKIIKSRKGYSQVVFLLDCSGSMTMDDNLDGIPEDRFKLMIDATKDCIEALFEDEKINEKLAVSLIGFSNMAIKIKDMTNNKDDVLKILDQLSIEGGTTEDGNAEIIALNNFTNPNQHLGTDINIGLQEAKNTFITDPDNPNDSNRIIVLISDGYATAHQGVPELELDLETFDATKTINPDDEFTTRLNQIAEETNEDLNSIMSDGITLVSLLTKLNENDGKADVLDKYDNYFINKTFNNELDDGTTEKASNYYLEILKEDEENYQNLIRTEVLDIIKANHNDGELTTYDDSGSLEVIGEEEIMDSIENEARRRAVKEYFSIIDNELATKFSIVENLNGNMQDIFNLGGSTKYRELINEVSQNTYMYVDTNMYDIVRIYEDDEYIYEDKGNGNVTIYAKADYEPNYEARVRILEAPHIANLILKKRSEFKIELDKKVTGIKLTLADGTILKDDANIEFSDMMTYPIIIDEEIMHGAKLDIEFSINIKTTRKYPDNIKNHRLYKQR